MDFEKELEAFAESSDKDIEFELPDGNVITVGDQQFRCAEAMFKPQKMLGKELLGLADLAFASILKCDIDVRKDLYENMVMSGGTTMFPGMPERFHKEMVKLAPSKVKVEINAP